jgi:hypothetical protein
MDNRCPICGKDLGRRKLAYSVIARMDVDCPHCGGGLSVHVHPAERFILLAGTFAALALATVSYVVRSQGLLLAAFAAGLAAAMALSAFERLRLRNWSRYVPRQARPGME